MVACEGEPSDDFLNDPEGTIALIKIPGNIYNLCPNNLTLLNFNAFDNAVLDPSIRVSSNPGSSTVSQDLEPEYCTIKGKKAYVTLQENNAIAIVDLKTKTITDIVGLGFKDHSLPGNGFDASNVSSGIDITTHPTLGMYQPDAIASYKVYGQTYMVTANEGDSRDYSGYSEEVRVKDLVLDPTAYPNAAILQNDQNLGRLKTTTATGDYDNDGDIDQIYSYGGRSFSILDASGNIVFDSGDMIEQITANILNIGFNASNDDQGDKDRSDDKGPEPEAVELAKIGGEHYAFIGLERVGGVMVFNISDPTNATFVDYINNRDFTQPITSPMALDLGPEEIVYIKKNQSPINKRLLVVSNEVSGSISIYSIDKTYQRSSGEDDNDEMAATTNGQNQQTTGIGSNGESIKEFVAYPNPTVGSFVFFGSNQQKIEVYDLFREQGLKY